MSNSDRSCVRSLAEAKSFPNALFYLNCENEIPVTSPLCHVNCSEEALRLLSDDLALYGLLTDATDCIFYATHPSENVWSAEQLQGKIWVAPKYEGVLGAAIRRLLSGHARDVYNDHFDPTAHFFPRFPNLDVGETSLYLSAMCGDWGLFARMLRCSPDINARNTDGSSPLHAAAREGFQAIVERLLSLGADINCRGAGGMTPLHAALIGQDRKRPPSIDTALLIIRSGADVNAADKYGVTPLDYLVRWCPQQRDLREMLLGRGAVRSGKLTI
jgi:hypothetical protein